MSIDELCGSLQSHEERMNHGKKTIAEEALFSKLSFKSKITLKKQEASNLLVQEDVAVDEGMEPKKRKNVSKISQ